MIATRPTYRMYQLALACLLLAGSAGPGRAAAVYTVTDLGPERGLGYIFDASGAPTPWTDGYIVRQRAGRYAVDWYRDPINGVAHSYLGADGRTPVELTSFGAASYGLPGTLSTNGNANVLASAVNASGVVVGIYEPHGVGLGILGTAFVYYGPQTGLLAVPLPPTPQPYYGFLGSAAYSINDSGLIVGTVGNLTSDGLPTHAFLSDGRSSWDLNTLLAPGSGVGLTDALDINAAGQIIARGLDSKGQYPRLPADAVGRARAVVAPDGRYRRPPVRPPEVDGPAPALS